MVRQLNLIRHGPSITSPRLKICYRASQTSAPTNTTSRFAPLDTINTTSFDADQYMNLILCGAGLSDGVFVSCFMSMSSTIVWMTSMGKVKKHFTFYLDDIVNISVWCISFNMVIHAMLPESDGATFISRLEGVVSLDERFLNYENDYFTHKSREPDQELMGVEDNNHINASISSYLRLLSGHFKLPSALRTLKYLIRRYKLEREELEMEFHAFKQEINQVKTNDLDMKRALNEKEKSLQESLQRVELLEKEIDNKDKEAQVILFFLVSN
ncbi:unnamed protein product [Lactuca saligna]|uniref:Uncharacterized protein n=1 Tax=Lactuca saligna TaxID=75948 RepID=A0AA35Z7P0_LACSI|nr:unnamed protein product [Lactuca saligna]